MAAQQKLAQAVLKWLPVLSGLAFVVGLGIFLALPSSAYNKGTYISENALLPNGARNTFDQNHVKTAGQILGGRANSLSSVATKSLFAKVEAGLKDLDLEVTVQSTTNETTGNVFGILRSPRGDGTESLLLSAPWQLLDGSSNSVGVSLLIALATHLANLNYLAKDIIVLFFDGPEGMNQWLHEYHGVCENGPKFACLGTDFKRAGAIQGAINIELGPSTDGLNAIGIVPEGASSRLPNLDLINTLVIVSENERVPVHIHGVNFVVSGLWQSTPLGDLTSYIACVNTLALMMFHQATGIADSTNSAMHRFKIDGLTLRGTNFGFNAVNLVSFGRVIEGTLRSCNNLLEHFHQSFFFYLLASPRRYVSIGLYMPAFIALVASLGLQAIYLWWRSGDSTDVPIKPPAAITSDLQEERPSDFLPYTRSPRDVFSLIPLLLLALLPGLLQWALLRLTSIDATMFWIILGTSFASSLYTSNIIAMQLMNVTQQQLQQRWMLFRSLTFATTAALLVAAAALNFSLAFFATLILVPILIVAQPRKWLVTRIIQIAFITALLPPILLAAVGVLSSSGADVLKQIIRSDAHGAWLLTFTLVLYWPALICATATSMITVNK